MRVIEGQSELTVLLLSMQGAMDRQRVGLGGLYTHRHRRHRWSDRLRSTSASSAPGTLTSVTPSTLATLTIDPPPLIIMPSPFHLPSETMRHVPSTQHGDPSQLPSISTKSTPLLLPCKQYQPTAVDVWVWESSCSEIHLHCSFIRVPRKRRCPKHFPYYLCIHVLNVYMNKI